MILCMLLLLLLHSSCYAENMSFIYSLKCFWVDKIQKVEGKWYKIQ